MEAGTGYSRECKSIAWVHRDGVRKAKATLGLNLARDVKGNKKCSVKTVTPKSRLRKTWAHSMTENMERQRYIFTSVFTGRSALWLSSSPSLLSGPVGTYHY